jgi:outer membrane protein TolC
MAPVGALGVASAGPVNAEQRWNAGFGAAYIISTNWEVFSFGRTRSRIRLSQAQTERESIDLEQTQFIHKVRVASAYLNLLIARQLLSSSEANLERVKTIQQSVKARTLSGLNPGVDSSLVNSEVSRAKLSVLEFVNNEQAVQQQLANLLNLSAENPVLPDTLYYSMLPQVDNIVSDLQANPQLRFFRSRADYANKVAEVTKRSILPGLTVFGVYQARASGFTNGYNPETSDGYSSAYWDGISPSRYNYVAGVSLSWNLMSPLKTKQQVHAQRFVAAGYLNEYEQLDRELQNQVVLSNQRIQNSLQTAREAPVQYQAASQAYLQKSVLYSNGLTTIVDLQQALYALNRAEIDQSVAFISVWNALLLKAAATGDFDLFINQAR